MNLYSDARKKWAVRIIAFLLIILCAITLKRTGEPRPLHLQVLGGLAASLVLNASLLLSCFPMRTWIRYCLGMMLVPSALGVAFVMTDYHLVFAALSLLFHIWVIAALFRKAAA